MDIFFYRSRLMNIAKNIRFCGQFFTNQQIDNVKNIINQSFNLNNQNTFELLYNKFNFLIKKYNLNVSVLHDVKSIDFPEKNDLSDNSHLYKILYDFLDKIDLFLSRIYKDFSNIQNILNLIASNSMDRVAIIPISSSETAINNSTDVQKSLSQVIITGDQYSPIICIQPKVNASVNDLRINSFIGNKQDQIKESDATTKIDD